MNSKQMRIVLVVVALFSFVSNAADVWFEGAGADNLWSTTENWAVADGDPPRVPLADDIAVLAHTSSSAFPDGERCLIDSSVNAVCSDFKGPGLILNWGTNYLDITGGTVDTSITWFIGWDSGSEGIVTISGGDVSVGNAVVVGHNGAAQIDMTGGTVTCQGGTYMPWSGTGTGQLNLDGGTWSTYTLAMRDPTGTGTIDISGSGRLEITVGDVRPQISQYVSDGWITAYGANPRASLEVVYDSVADKTVVTSVLLDNNQAYSPSPVHYAAGASRLAILSWSAGDSAAAVDGHDVYFGTDYDAVNNGDASVHKGRQTATTYDPGQLDYGTTYYWRVDENDGAGGSWTGAVWRFTTEAYQSVDDMESYNSTTNKIYDTWIDGYGDSSNGAYVSLELDEVNEGLQAMNLRYGFSGGPSSEIVRTYGTVQDWTAEEVTSLAIHLKGGEDNTGGPLHVQLQDGDGDNSAQLLYSGSLVQEAWEPFERWDIDLQDFITTGFDLNKVKKITIRISSGAGTVYIDDIRLYPARCIPEYATGSINDDCIVDQQDLDLLVIDWLSTTTIVNASVPSVDPLVEYNFDETSGSFVHDFYDANDTSVDPNTIYDGVIVGGPGTWDTSGGHDGKGCLDFDGTMGVAVPTELFADHVNDEITVSVWVKGDQNLWPRSDQVGFIFNAIRPGAHALWGIVPWTTTGIVSFLSGWEVDGNPQADVLEWQSNGADDWKNIWNHYAFTKNAATGVMRTYHNGVLVAERTDATKLIQDVQWCAIGSKADIMTEYYYGRIDDFKLYNKELSHSEIVSLAGLSQVSQILDTRADLDENERVDLKDFAIMSAAWLSEIMWPN